MPRGHRVPLDVMLRATREVDNGVPVLRRVPESRDGREDLLSAPGEVRGDGGDGGSTAAGHISWQSAGKRGGGGALRDNIPYGGPPHPSRPDRK